MAIDYTRRSFKGSAVQTTLNGNITAVSGTIAVNATTGWPDGSGGPFFVTIDPGTSSEEHVLISSVSGTTLTVAASGRGKDDTTAQTHLSGATIYPSWSATDADTANAHYNDAFDNHAQYLNTTRHDITGRHVFGGALGTRGTPSSIGTSNSAGSSSQLVAADHVHSIGAAAINNTFMFAAGVITSGNIANNTITTTQISGTAGITGAQLANATITNTQVSASAAIDRTKLVSACVGTPVLRTTAQTGLTGANVDLTGVSITATTTGTRNLLVLSKIGFQITSAAPGTVTCALLQAGSQIDQDAQTVSTSNGYCTVTFATPILALAAGTYTWKLQAGAQAGTFQTTAAANTPISLTIVDIT